MATLVAGLLVAALAAVFTARQLYLQKAELRLTPVNAGRFLQENAALGPKHGRRVVFFGDSRINQWQQYAPSAGAEVLWRGVDGETTAQMAYRFHQDVTAVQADAVVIQAGINDIVAGAALGRERDTGDSALRNLADMVEAARAKSVQVHLLTVIRPAKPPLSRWLVWSRSIPDDVGRLNDGIRQLAGPGVSVIDADGILSGDLRALPDRFSRDTLHLNAAGYRMLNQLVAPALVEGNHAVQ